MANDSQVDDDTGEPYVTGAQFNAATGIRTPRCGGRACSPTASRPVPLLLACAAHSETRDVKPMSPHVSAQAFLFGAYLAPAGSSLLANLGTSRTASRALAATQLGKLGKLGKGAHGVVRRGTYRPDDDHKPVNIIL